MKNLILFTVAFAILTFVSLAQEEFLSAALLGSAGIVSIKILWEQMNIKETINQSDNMWEIYYVTAVPSVYGDDDYIIQDSKYLGHMEMVEWEPENIIEHFKSDNIIPLSANDGDFAFIGDEDSVKILNKVTGKPYYIIKRV